MIFVVITTDSQTDYFTPAHARGVIIHTTKWAWWHKFGGGGGGRKGCGNKNFCVYFKLCVDY